MKKLKIIGTLFLSIASANLKSATVGTLILRGQVNPILSLALSPEAIASNLDFSNTVNDLKIATVTEKSNSSTGYKVSITSANLGKMKRVDGSELIAYSIKYNNASVNLASASGTTFSNSGVTNGALNKNLTISYVGFDSSLMKAGVYQDEITLTISAQ